MAARRLGLPARQRAGAAGLHLPDGAALHAVRPGQVRLPAAGAGRARAHRRQRHGGDGHLRRHPAGQRRRRPAGRACRRSGAQRWRVACVLLALVGRAVAQCIPAAPATDPGLHDQLEPVQRDLAQPEAGARQPRGVPLAAGHQLDVVLRRGVPEPVPAASPRRCCTATSRWRRCCWWCSRSASASARCCARCCRAAMWRSAWCRSARSA